MQKYRIVLTVFASALALVVYLALVSTIHSIDTHMASGDKTTHQNGRS